jgi:transposase
LFGLGRGLDGNTEKELSRIAREVSRRTRTPLRAEQIALKVGKVLQRWRMGKHFEIRIEDNRLEWSRRTESIEREEMLDGIYVVRTSESASTMSAADTVRGYKALALVERAFRCLKGLDLRIRPIYHRKDEMVRAHVLLCLLAYYVEWHLRRAWAPLLFEDEQLPQNRESRDPVAAARISESARGKKARGTTQDGYQLHSYRTLLAQLATRTRNTCSTPIRTVPRLS